VDVALWALQVLVAVVLVVIQVHQQLLVQQILEAAVVEVQVLVVHHQQVKQAVQV
jgi:hypothetical protein